MAFEQCAGPGTSALENDLGRVVVEGGAVGPEFLHFIGPKPNGDTALLLLGAAECFKDETSAGICLVPRGPALARDGFAKIIDKP